MSSVKESLGARIGIKSESWKEEKQDKIRLGILSN